MTQAALLIAIFLHHPPDYIQCVLEIGGIDAVAVVEYESRFNPRAWRREIDGTSWGLFQLYDKCHKQYREDILLHIVAGTEFLAECKKVSGGSLARAYSIYNSGTSWISIKKGRQVERLRDRLLDVLVVGLVTG